MAVMGGTRLPALDADIASWLHRQATPPLTAAMVVWTTLNSTWAVAVYAAAIGAVQAWHRRWRRVVMLAACIGGGLALNALVKLAFARTRPAFDDPLLTLQTYSFPSGHVAGTTIFYGLFVAWAFGRTASSRWRLAAGVAGAAMIALTAFSRLYLGVHFLSDTVAGFAEGLAWLALCLTALAVLWPAFAPPAPPSRLATP